MKVIQLNTSNTQEPNQITSITSEQATGQDCARSIGANKRTA